MAQEEVVMTVKANISPAKKQVDELTKSLNDAEKAQKDLNDAINLQTEGLIKEERILIKLKAQRDALGNDGWSPNMAVLNKQIKSQTTLIQEEKNTLKDLQNQQKGNTQTIKENNKELKKRSDNIKKTNKELKETQKTVKEGIGNFRLFGVSINDIQKSLGKVIPTIKLMFGTIKAGILSTGIGALLIAFGTLATYFTSTKRGADQLSVIFAGLGAAVNVLRDRLVKVGESLFNIFDQPFIKTLKDIKGAFTGITEEVTKEVAIMTALEKRVKALRDAEIEFTVQRAETRKEIEKARLLAEDETKSQEERIAALKTALDLETETVNKELELAKERVAIQEEQMDTAENKVEAEKKLADFRADVINKETRSFRLQKRVQTEINQLEREIQAERLERLRELQRLDKERTGKLTEMRDIETEMTDKFVQDSKKKANAALAFFNAERSLDKKRVESKKDINNQILSATGSFAGALSSLAEDNKQLAAAGALIDTYAAVQQVMSDKTIPSTVLKFITAGSVLASGLANVKRIFSVDVGGGSSGGSTPSMSEGTPAPEMLSGKFELSPPTEQQPVQAYVVTDNLTDNQNKLAYIRRRATI
jgi:DNA repair exonuclease SbcCD ATPase subunit